MPSRRLRRSLAAPALVALVALAACGGDDASTDDTTDATTDDPTNDTTDATTGDTSPTTTAAPSDKPEVEFPGADPTELTLTELEAGTGAEAVEGDTIVVDYVGVRAVDGVEFDNSYDPGTPFAMKIGAGQVIPGWDQGLVGVRAGGRYQLDIPADLAYGEEGSGELIRPGDSLTFVVDVRALVPAGAEAPDVTVEGADPVDALETEDLVTGEGTAAAEGDTVAIHLVAYNGADGAVLDNSWEGGQPITILLQGDSTLSGLVEGIAGMQPGGRRMMRIPFEQAWGADGNEAIGLPASTDLVLVIDLFAAW